MVADQLRLLDVLHRRSRSDAFRHTGGDADNERIRDAINDGGQAYVTHTKLDGQIVLRIAIGAVRTEQRHIDAMFDLLDDLA